MYCKLVNPNCIIEPIFHDKNPKAHGLNDDEVMRYLKSQESSYLFINDASTNDTDFMEELVGLKWLIYTTDHHLQSIDNPYCTLVNNQISNNVINKGLSGTGVIWKCLKRYDETYGYNYAKGLISYVMCSIISDSMSLLYEENYSFIKWGKMNIHKNLLPFIETFNKGDTNKDYSYGFVVKINSTIRLGTLDDKNDLFYALCGELDDIDDLINRMNKLHTKQSNEVNKLIENNVEEVYNNKIGLFNINTKSSLTGLVANKLMSKYNKPILLVYKNEKGECSGSCRSPIPIKNQLNESGLFVFNEGHLLSFGTCYMKDKEQDIINYFENMELEEPTEIVLLSTNTSSLSNNLFNFKEDNKQYFGTNIPIPKFHIHSIHINGKDIRELGNGSTIKFSYKGVDFIKFFCSKEFKEQLHISKNKPLSIEVIGELDKNIFRGKVTNQVVIDKIEVKDYNKSVNDIF